MLISTYNIYMYYMGRLLKQALPVMVKAVEEMYV